MQYCTYIIGISLLSVNSFAEPACQPVDTLSAHYQVTTNNSKAEKPSKVVVLRQGNQVAYRYESAAITELWEHTSNNRVRLVRYFDQYKRGVEYQPNEVKHHQNWSIKTSLISQSLLNSTTNTTHDSQDCDTITQHQGQHNKQLFSVKWHPRYQLPTDFTVSDDQGHLISQWTLLDIKTDKNDINTALSQFDQYQTTDYTDIGDSESDPFLRKMIHLGFIDHGHSGVYDAAGNSLDHPAH